MKFGGSCLVDDKAFGKILEITNLYKNEKKIYVASAFSGITDLLLNTARNLDDSKKIDDNLALLEKRHFDVIEEIFDENSSQLERSKIWVEKQLSELEDAFEDMKEFGLESYYIDYVSGFGEAPAWSPDSRAIVLSSS